MTEVVFKINDVEYNVFVEKLSQEFTIQDGPNAGETVSGETVRDLIGTKIKYSMTLSREGDVTEYDRLWEKISDPHEFYIVEMPYNQTTLKFKAYVTGGSRDLILRKDGKNYWGPLQINFVGKSLYKNP